MKKSENIIIIALAAFILLAPSRLYAQEKPIFESATTLYEGQSPGFFGGDESGLYFYNLKSVDSKPHLIIEKKNINTLELIFSKEVPDYNKFQSMVRRSSPFVQCFLINAKVYCFYQYIDNKKDTMYVMLQTVTSSGEVSEVYNVLKVPTRNTWASSVVKFSPDNEFFFVCPNPNSLYLNPFAASGEKFNIDLQSKLYKTTSLELIWEKNLSSYVNNLSYKASEFTIDNNKNLYFLIEDKNKNPQLSVLQTNSPTLKQIPELLSPDIKYEGVALKILKNGDVMYSGIVGGKVKDLKGFYKNPTFFLRIINPDNLTVKIKKDYPFDNNIMGKLSTGIIAKKPTAEQKKSGLEPSNLFSSPIIHEFDDGYYFVTEDVFTDVFAYKLHLKDIIVLKVSKEGDLKFMNLIPRYNIDSYRLKLETVVINKQLFLLFGENTELASKNIKNYDSATMPQMEDCYGNVVILNSTNESTLNKKTLFENKKKELLYFSGRNWVFEDNKILFMLENTRANSVKYVTYKIN